ncbi:hypothetical protein F4802DRAFT_609844 [Xylaria palmicola]|nr:hypothetical protein F4802DRAFT_609844 [Xylaria palmicola]
MGSMRLGGRNTIPPAATCASSSKSPIRRAAGKTNPLPSGDDENNNKNNKNYDEKASSTRTAGRNNNAASSASTTTGAYHCYSAITAAATAARRPPLPLTRPSPLHTTTTSTALSIDDRTPPSPPPPPIAKPPIARPPPAAKPARPPRPPLRPPPTTITVSTTSRRPPLKLRDQNVAPVPAPVLKESGNMGYDTTLNPSTASSNRPHMPPLSAAAARGINRAPLTPKVASAAKPSQPQTPNLAAAAATTPVPRRTQPRPTSAVSVAASSSNSHRPLPDDPNTASATTFSPLLSSNITPRSGSRQSRVDSANSTPNGTPNHDRPDPWEPRSGFTFPSPLNQGDMPRRPVVTFSAVSPERNNPPRHDMTSQRDAKFFHASDAKTARPAATKTSSPKNSTFFYANGNGIAPIPANPATLSPPLSPGLSQSHHQDKDKVSRKFVYANGTPELRPTPPPLVSRGSGSTVSAASKGPTVRPTAALQRPISPSKLPLHSLSYRNSAAPQNATLSTIAGASTTRVQVSPPPPLVSSTPGLQRPGTATSRSSGHSRSGSLVKGDAAAEPSRPIASPTLSLFPPANLCPMKPPPLTLASIIQAADEFAEGENDVSPDDHSVLQSPTKSTGSSSDPVTELIANARRERKVQDLQIRNASLEAINRTLERQLRKQTAELRRYRRLSRSGRLSLASTALSSRVPSGTMSELELESLGLSDLSEEDFSTEELEDESFSDSESASSGLSPSILAERDAKHRHRDEERLQLDLSKHQQILVDSQKINQSIKRCLDWSEELIKDGRKALEYKVRVSDVQLGGRVLDPLDEEEDSPGLSPADNPAADDLKPMEDINETSMSWGIEPQDRDSGIELPRDGE